MTPETQLDERPLRERFAALEHPPEEPDWAEVLLLTGPTVRQRPPGRRRPLLALAAALVLAAAAGAAAIAVLSSGEDAASVSATGEPLAPLPVGPPTPGPESMQQVIRVTLDELVEQADVVFVGVVEAVGGSEPLTGPDVPVTVHRVRFLVERPLRGIGEGLVDITEFDSISLASGIDFAPGERYLVFAEPEALAAETAPALVPLGYGQGVFRVTGDDTAANEPNGEVRLSELEARLADGR